MTTRRERILNYLRAHASATLEELERALKMQPPTLRYHLRKLEEAGLIEAEKQSEGRRGRPSYRYRLSHRLQGDNLPRLIEVLFALLKERGLGGEALAFALAKGLNELGPGAEPQVPETNRLRLTLEFLQRLHYRPRWEAAAQGPRVFFQHCPYYEILAAHPELCQMDVHLLEGCLKKSVTLLSRGDWETGHGGVCIFQVQG
ncbi:MAG: ArsR family transcriptional regulator [Anaerolineales bacterium]